ncbi:2297_t:CDS:2 [Funneliformis mosseae]|uniref:2297_t:CDS:1 n=1 Tax=Funneliformis mosseae TaxID=27381 RepID=A0A9N9FSQ0_FUNMO|nr:2297_t:CDS:2 [Funneliformis mosseae]
MSDNKKKVDKVDIKSDNYKNNASKWIENALKSEKVKFIPFNQLINSKQLTNGGFGSIMKATWIKTGNCIIYKKLTNIQSIKDLSFQYEKASDIYSYGVLMWEISSGIPPFKNFTSKCDQDLLYFNIPKGYRENTIEGTPEDYKELFEKCWNSIPEKRPNIKKVLEEFKKMGFGIDDVDNSTYEDSAPKETEISIKNISAEEQTNELNRLLDTHDDLISKLFKIPLAF